MREKIYFSTKFEREYYFQKRKKNHESIIEKVISYSSFILKKSDSHKTKQK